MARGWSTVTCLPASIWDSGRISRSEPIRTPSPNRGLLTDERSCAKKDVATDSGPFPDDDTIAEGHIIPEAGPIPDPRPFTQNHTVPGTREARVAARASENSSPQLLRLQSRLFLRCVSPVRRRPPQMLHVLVDHGRLANKAGLDLCAGTIVPSLKVRPDSRPRSGGFYLDLDVGPPSPS